MPASRVSFFADRVRLDGDLYLPDTAGPHPVVVACSGYQGLKDIHPARFARALTPLGYAVLAFDYQGFGYSEGERGRVVPQAQVEDVRAAVAFVSTHPNIDRTRVALLGWGLGGGVVVAEAADDPRVHAVVALQAIADGGRSIRGMHDAESFERLRGQVEADRDERVHAGRSRVVHPFDIVRLDRDARTDGYVAEELYKASNFGGFEVSLETADYYLRFRPVDVVHRIAPRPLLLIHGEGNRLHDVQESRDLYAAAGEPKTLTELPNAGHTEWMFDENEVFQGVSAQVRDFLDTAFDRSASLS